MGLRQYGRCTPNRQRVWPAGIAIMKSLVEVFAESLMIDAASVTDDLAYQAVKEWDSVAHMVLVTALEDNFGIMLETDDIIAMSSVAKVREILARYDVAA
jgi:acyl carrier protein